MRKISTQENRHVYKSCHINKASLGTFISKIQIMPLEVTQCLTLLC